MAVTRKQVAQRAGVSEATVSYVVNNGPRPVAVGTRERILAVIEELGYHPSDVARSLRLQRTSTIGLILPDTANPFYGEIARIIENASYSEGHTVILCNSNLDPVREREYIHILRAKRVAGLVIIPTSAEGLELLRDANICTVVLEYETEGAYCLVADDFQGGRIATEHLLKLGHRRIGCITRARDTSSSRNRVQGYRTALENAGVCLEQNLIVETEASIGVGEAATFHLLDQPQPPTAIFAHSDVIALGALSAIHKRGLRVPDDVSVVGYDDIDEAPYFNPPLTTIAYPKQAMGEGAARLLIDLIQNPKSPEPHITVLETLLIERASTAPLKQCSG
jgi:LacI family transcriptional regulator, galactose operon repressor